MSRKNDVFSIATKSPFMSNENRRERRRDWLAAPGKRLGVRMLALLLVLCAMGTDYAFGAFGLSTNTDNYTVDTGAGLVFKIRRTDNGSSTQSPGDIMSMVYNGVEYQDQSRGSQINSGFDWLYNSTSAVTVSATQFGTNYIRITVQAGNLTHYYMARNGYPYIYMATYFTTEPDTLGLCRYIVRIPSNLLPNGPAPSDIRNNTGAIESSDIFGMADGTTRSKHYSNHRLMDWSYIGATGNNVGVFMLRGTHEGDSGGPFYRCLLNQCGSDQEITYIVNYGEAQTEPFRTNILDGPYTLEFTGGGLPDTNLDYSWMQSAGLNLTGWVSKANRGAVSGIVSGVPAGFQPVVGFANSHAEYWTMASTNGSYTTPLMIPGTYTATLYKGELKVATGSITVTAGATNTLNLISTEPNPTYIWKLGEWDGSPTGMLNADKITTMHPSDVRMANWSPWPFTVGRNNVSQFPCAQFRGANSPAVIKFNLTASQITTLTLRIGTTCNYDGGRPQITVNSWQSSIPPAPSQPKTRSITVGTYRENNILYTYNIPASALVVGQNTLEINPVSGSSDLGPWLSASWVYDCVELDGPVVSVPTEPTGLVTTSGNAQVKLQWNGSPAATSYNIKRAAASVGTYVLIATGVKAPTYTDESVVNGTTYDYVVSAENSQGESSDSLLAVAKPTDLPDEWNFDEDSGTTAFDSVGTNDATLASGASWTSGKTGSAVHLNGSASSYVSFPEGLVRSLNDFTIATWVKVDTNATWARIFDFGTGTGNYMFLTPASGNNTVRYAITTTFGNNEQVIDVPGILSTGVWHHLAVTLSGSTGVLYIDGVARGTNNDMTLRPSDLGATTQNYLGKSQYSDPNLNGSIDDFRIYDRALSASQIQALAAPPGTPGDVNAIAGDAQVRVNWNRVASASGYRVQRALNVGGAYLTVTNTTDTNFVNTGLANGTRYFFEVSATNDVGASPESIPASARPTSPDPTQIATVANGSQLQLHWPQDHTGWILQVQTNTIGVGLGTNWFTVPNSTATNLWSAPFDAANGSVFFRLVSPY